MPPTLKIRVIAGKYRSRLLQHHSESTRPTKDRVKEALFSALGQKLKSAVVADLFAGTGALGIEALSRGANRAYFVENNSQALKTLKLNLKMIEEEYNVYEDSFEHFLFECPEQEIDILFVDPPYDYQIDKILTAVFDKNILKADAVIALETNQAPNISVSNATIKRYKYGITHLTIIWRNL